MPNQSESETLTELSWGLGRSMRGWLERMGVAYGGETAKALREQAARISACPLKFFWDDEGRDAEGWAAGRIVTSGLHFHASGGEAQDALWEDRVELDPTFYRALCEHPVPCSKRQSASFEIGRCHWTCMSGSHGELHTLERETPISWLAIFGQFGEGHAQLRHFKPRFTEALAAAVAAYPDARVDVGDAGIVMRPSRPPISKRQGGIAARA